jgi:hypothetical protein
LVAATAVGTGAVPAFGRARNELLKFRANPLLLLSSQAMFFLSFTLVSWLACLIYAIF